MDDGKPVTRMEVDVEMGVQDTMPVEVMEVEEEPPDEKVYELPCADVCGRRRFLISQIEDLVRDIIGSIARNEKPSFSYDDGKYSGWSSCSSSSSSNSSEQDTISKERVKTIRFSGYKCRQRFALMMRIISYVYEKLVNNLEKSNDDFYCTKRAFFYTLKNEQVKRFVEKQSKVEWAINEVTLLLGCGPWEIGFISTSKGLVAGDLSLYLGDKRVMNYGRDTYQAVPDVIDNVTRIRTTAKFVVVVEKDSVFQKLLGEGCPTYNNCILVTGKGYPDQPTRMLVHILSEKANLPVYALVDCNPHGFEIMCVYRFGTLNNLGYREKLLCPGMRWLGVHQEDLMILGIPRIKLTDSDLKKISDLMNRSYVDENFSKHLMDMKMGKAEIESVNVPLTHFLTEYFIPGKIRRKKYL